VNPPSRFDKRRRVRRRGEFQQVFDSGQRGRGRFFTVLVAKRPAPSGVEGPAGETRLGIVASKKLGDAVRRNRAKRLIREIFRKNVPPLALGGVDIVVIPRTELFDATFASLQEDFHAVLARFARTGIAPSRVAGAARPRGARHARS
jgi:ribonuclease P protein component